MRLWTCVPAELPELRIYVALHNLVMVEVAAVDRVGSK